MSNLRVTTTQGTPTVLGADMIQGFKSSLRGELLVPLDVGYEEARTVWNGMIDHHPALIARCAGAADVITAAQFVRDHQLLVSVRGGGHNVAGLAVCQGGLMIDLSRMKGIRVDPDRRLVRAEPGVTWAEFDRETQAFGLATTGGFMSTTGIAGLTLGGGLGYLMRRFGLACDNLMSVDIVTADGQLRRASASEHPDLFWGLRGGGGNFGIVTSFQYRLHPLGPMVLGGLLIYPIGAAKEAFQFYREFTPTAPDELTVYLGFATSPEGYPVVAAIVSYSGAMEQGEAIIGPLRKFATPVADLVSPMPYTALQALSQEMFPPGRLNYWKSSFVYDLSDQAIDTMVSQFVGVPSPFSQAALEQLGGAVGRIGADETAFRERSAPYSLIIASAWTDPADNDKNIRWTREFWQAMRPYASEAAYVNYLDGDESDRIRAVYGETYARLVAVKNKYDPTNLFRHNQNIPPTS